VERDRGISGRKQDDLYRLNTQSLAATSSGIILQSSARIGYKNNQVSCILSFHSSFSIWNITVLSDQAQGLQTEFAGLESAPAGNRSSTANIFAFSDLASGGVVEIIDRNIGVADRAGIRTAAPSCT